MQDASCQTAGLFLLGMPIGRKQLFDVLPEATIRFWVKALIWSRRSVWSSLSVESAIDGCPDRPDMIRQTVGVVMDMWQKFAST
ncbi:MAG: hypothetical protein ACLULL_06065 [Parabacteroides distasonis]